MSYVGRNASLPLVAVVACLTAKGLKHKPLAGIGDMAVTRLLLPSLLRTREPHSFRYQLFLGIDDDDDFWKDAAHLADLRRRAGSLQVIVRGFPKKKHRVPFNDILKVAKDADADYLVRVNDDSEFLTNNWTTFAVQTLASYSPPNVGVVGPTCRQGNTRILTHDFVHRTHMNIFKDEYYPCVFDAWFTDSWISQVYGPKRTTKLKNWKVKHHTDHHGTRYQPQYDQKRLLGLEVIKGSSMINSWQQHRSKD